MVFLLNPLILVGDGMFLLLLEINKALFELLSIPKLSFNQFGIWTDDILDLLF